MTDREGSAPECRRTGGGEKIAASSPPSYASSASAAVRAAAEETARGCVEALLRGSSSAARNLGGKLARPPSAAPPSPPPPSPGRIAGVVASVVPLPRLRLALARIVPPVRPPPPSPRAVPRVRPSARSAAPLLPAGSGEAALLLLARLAVCLAASHGGLSIRVAYGPSWRSVAGDVAAAASENYLLLSCWEWARRGAAGAGAGRSPAGAEAAAAAPASVPLGDGTPFLPRSSPPPPPSKGARCGRVAASLLGGPFRRRCRRRIGACLRSLLFSLLALTWTAGSWGDYVFQAESSGRIPTMWVIAPGLRDPALHAGVQMRTKGDVFWGGLAKVCSGLLGGIACWAFLARVQSKRRRTAEEGGAKKKDSDLDCADCGKARRECSDNEQRRCKCRRGDSVRSSLKNPAVYIAALLLVLFSTGSWAPTTNLIYCAVGSAVLAPPGGRRIDPKVLTKKRAEVVAARGIPVPARAADGAADGGRSPGGASSGRRRPPNVIVVVHESLGGAALEGRRGREAAPYWHDTLKRDPDFYAFRNGRAVAGTTPVATPAILTGLLPYEDGCLSELRAAGGPGHEFRSAGYDTGSFVSYGHDWAGGPWAVIDDLVKPGFDFFAGPGQTGEPLVNEYGMDDRALTPYLRRWMAERGRNSAGGNATGVERREGGVGVGDTATAADPRRENAMLRGAANDTKASGKKARSDKPFFALVIFNNNHYPHLRHETYTALPSECFENATSEPNKGCRGRMPQSDFVGDWDQGAGVGDWDQETGDSNTVAGADEIGTDDEASLGVDDCDYDSWYPSKKYYRINGEMYDCEGDVGHYYSSIRTMDESLREIFRALEEAGELNNTIVVGAGDHGETPMTLKRLGDVDAPILQVPVWMRVPRGLLPERAWVTPTNSAANRNNTRGGIHGPMNDTYLRSNLDRTVSVLDIMPTLRDILNYTHIYTEDERRLCVTGMSLLSRTVPDRRIAPGWQGPPLQPGQKTGVFMTRTEALVHYEGDVAGSHVAEFRFDDEDPIFTLFERRGEDWTSEERRSWAEALRDGGWLEGGQRNGLVSRRMPKLEKALEDVVSPWQMDENEDEGEEE